MNPLSQTPLHQFGDWVRELLLRIPLGAARGFFILVLLMILVWVLSLPRHQTTRGEGPIRPSENLRVWAAAALIIQIAIYSLF